MPQTEASVECDHATPASLDRRRIAVVAAIGLAFGFFQYGCFRTFSDQVGFELRRLAPCLLGLVIFSCPMFGLALLAGAAFHRFRAGAATVTVVCGVGVALLLIVAGGNEVLYVFHVGPAASGVVLAGTMHGRTSHARALGVLVCATLVGAALSEGWVLLDEARFRDEIAASGADHQIGRARWWPNGAAGMQYAPDRGVWGTD